ncbi:hypothetical protein THIOM_004765 [Candidatus Thiomargarita nelsonii]|uniref:Uncharacterized protein n=1 Tax=Candidatus Thiomargarita nelsonii TaxID=1003181 RepID=A0A176RV08_9GAMM|nr:hypothetical protein THIOM_004765 [Candidatus Thiomargarita nelsonii]
MFWNENVHKIHSPLQLIDYKSLLQNFLVSIQKTQLLTVCHFEPNDKYFDYQCVNILTYDMGLEFAN